MLVQTLKPVGLDAVSEALLRKRDMVALSTNSDERIWFIPAEGAQVRFGEAGEYRIPGEDPETLEQVTLVIRATSQFNSISSQLEYHAMAV